MNGGISYLLSIEDLFTRPSQGWHIIYFIPYNDPSLCLVYFFKSPHNKFFIYGDNDTWLGNYSYYVKID
jgi:hypothetical protein